MCRRPLWYMVCYAWYYVCVCIFDWFSSFPVIFFCIFREKMRICIWRDSIDFGCVRMISVAIESFLLIVHFIMYICSNSHICAWVQAQPFHTHNRASSILSQVIRLFSSVVFFTLYFVMLSFDFISFLSFG